MSEPIGGCGGCAREWSALGESHCRGCHAHFGSDTAFDRHLIRNYNRRGWSEHSGVPAVECLSESAFGDPVGKSAKPRLVQVERTSSPSRQC
jgi:hypothetical protein